MASTLLLAASGGHAQIAPPAGSSRQGEKPGLATSADFGAPKLRRIPNDVLADRFAVARGYQRGASTRHTKVVGAFEVEETAQLHPVAAWSAGFLPVTLLFDTGECYALQADYVGGTLSNGRLSKVVCNEGKVASEAPPPPPDGSRLAFIGNSWNYAAWADRRTRTTIITAPHSNLFKPLFTARMTTIAIMAMNGPDYPGGNVTLVGRINGRFAVVTLEVG